MHACSVVEPDLQEGTQRTKRWDLSQRQHDNVYDAPLHTSKQARVGALLLSHPGLGNTRLGPGMDTRGTPVLTLVRRPWAAEPHIHAHATQATDTRDVNTGEDHPSKISCISPLCHTCYCSFLICLFVVASLVHIDCPSHCRAFCMHGLHNCDSLGQPRCNRLSQISAICES